MCTVFVAHQVREDWPFVVAANRDEFYARRTAPLAWRNGVMAGQDLKQGGYWMASDGDRFAVLTNYRNPPVSPERPVSRGRIVKDFVHGKLAPQQYLQTLARDGDQFEGFNVLLKARGELWYYSNVSGDIRRCEPGVYGLSNHLLDTPWPKVCKGRRAFESVLAQSADRAECVERLRGVLCDRSAVPDEQLPDTGVPLRWDRLLASLFIVSPVYGTRSCSVYIEAVDGDGVFDERRYGVMGRPLGTECLAFRRRV